MRSKLSGSPYCQTASIWALIASTTNLDGPNTLSLAPNLASKMNEFCLSWLSGPTKGTDAGK